MAYFTFSKSEGIYKHIDNSFFSPTRLRKLYKDEQNKFRSGNPDCDLLSTYKFLIDHPRFTVSHMYKKLERRHKNEKIPAYHKNLSCEYLHSDFMDTEIVLPNSGAVVINNCSVHDIEGAIDELLNESNSNCGFSPSDILKSNKKEIQRLLESDQTVGHPIRQLMVESFKIRLNPELNANDKILDQLGFNKCVSCYGQTLLTTIPEMLPF